MYTFEFDMDAAVAYIRMATSTNEVFERYRDCIKGMCPTTEEVMQLHTYFVGDMSIGQHVGTYLLSVKV